MVWGWAWNMLVGCLDKGCVSITKSVLLQSQPEALEGGSLFDELPPSSASGYDCNRYILFYAH